MKQATSSIPTRSDTPARPIRTLTVLAAGAAASVAAAAAIPGVPVLLAAVVFGVLVGRFHRILDRALAQRIARSALKWGVVLLGFRVSLREVLQQGVTGLLAAVVLVAVTFAFTVWLGRRLRVPEGTALLMAAGVSVCGASAVAAMAVAVDADDDDIGTAISVVTVLGTIAMVAYPLIGLAMALPDAAFAAWVGGSVHELAQVVGAADSRGVDVIELAVISKLARVVLLAPLVAWVGRRHLRRATESTRSSPTVPGFVVGFLAAGAVTSWGVLPATALATLGRASSVCFIVALFAVGTGTRLTTIWHVGRPSAYLGTLASLVIAALALGLTVFS